MSDVFVSYKAEDRPRVAPLVKALQADGYSVWWDEQIGGGSAWRQAIETELSAAKCVTVIWSNRSVGPDGAFVQDEASRAQQRHVYVPVMIDKVRPPLGFGETQALPLTGWHGNRSDPKYQAVLSAVRRNVGDEHFQTRPIAQPRIDRRTMIAGGAVAAVAVAGAGGWALLKPSSASASDSIAVLPFENLSGDPNQAYFSDGIAEELRSALARVAQLKVVARTSSEAVRNEDAKAAARKLGVANILTGSVRRSPATIRVSAQLVDGATGLERWSQDFDRPSGDALAIESNIAQSVAEALRIQLGRAATAVLTLGGTSNAAAQDLYLQADPGRRDDTAEGIQRSIAQLDAAIRLDPNYAKAYARKAGALSNYAGFYARSPAEARSILGQAENAAKRAIALAPDLSEAHAALASIYVNGMRFKDSWREMEAAVTLPGADALTLANEALYLAQGRHANESMNAATRAVALDPLNPGVLEKKAYALFLLHQFAPAAAAARQALELGSSRPAGHRILGYSLIMMRRYDEASAEFSKLPGNNGQALSGRAVIAALSGDMRTADQLTTDLQQRYGDSASYQYAEIYAQRKDPDRAFRSLEKAIAVRDTGVSYIRSDPFLDPIRSDPRFAEIVRRLDFPA